MHASIAALLLALLGAALSCAQDAPCPADFDGDGAISFADVAEMLACVIGPDSGFPLPCGPADLDLDEDCDLHDVALLQQNVSGLAGVQHADLAGQPLDGDPHFEFVRAINDDQFVYIAIDPFRYPGVYGQTADLYIVAARAHDAWLCDATLVDVRPDGPQSLTFDGLTLQQNTFTVAEPGALNSLPPIGLGVAYDIVLDFDQDGTLSAGDFLDGGTALPGFTLVSDSTQPGALHVSVIEIRGGPWLGQRIYYPTDIANMGQLPVYMVGHGWTHAYTYYDHIGYHLASYGYVVSAMTNDVGDGDPAGTHSASLTVLDNTDYLFKHQNTIAGGLFQGHLDSHRIGFTGHSTGGEAVVRAYTRLRTGQYVPDAFDVDDIVVISSIAPVAWLSRSDVSPFDVNYHQFIAAADTDASGAPVDGYQQSMAIYERGSGNRQLTYVHGAGHSDFHTADQWPYAYGPDLIGKAAGNTVVRGYVVPLLERYARGNHAAQDFFARLNDRFRPIGIPENVIIANEFIDADDRGNFVIDDFQTQTDPAVSSSGGAVTFSVNDLDEVLMRDQNGSFDWDAAQPSNGMTRYRTTGDDPRCVVFDWPQGIPRYYEQEIVSDQRDFSRFEALTFRACQGTRHPETDTLDAPLSFTITLRDTSGTSSSIDFGRYGHVTRTYLRDGFGTGAGWGNEFNTVRIQLADFTTNGSGLDLSNIAAVRFQFGPGFGSPRGRVGVDDLEATLPPPRVPPPALEIDFPAGLPARLQPEVPTEILVEITPIGQRVLPGTPTLHYAGPGAALESEPLSPRGGNLYLATLPAWPCGTIAPYWFTAEGALTGLETEPPTAPNALFFARAADEIVVLDEPLDTNPGWTTGSQWAFGPPAGGGGSGSGGPDPTSGATGSHVYGVNLLGDYTTTPHPAQYLTLGPLDLTGVFASRLLFQRWLNCEAQPWVEETVEVSANGVHWTQVWFNWSGPFANESFLEETAWIPMDLDISAVADDAPTVWIRWGHRVVSPTIPMSGWNVDDVQVRGAGCGGIRGAD